MITYIVQEDGYETDDIDMVIDHCIDGEYHRDDDIEEWINDTYSSYSIGGYSYSAYEILDRFDDLGDFRDEYCESCDESDADEARWELRHAINGERISIQSYTVIVRIEDDATACTEHETAVSGEEMLESLRKSVELIRSQSKEIEQQNESTLQNYLDFFQSM